MIYLALNSKNVPMFSHFHWKKFMDTHFPRIDSSKAILIKNTKQIVIHPLWSDTYIQKIKENIGIADYSPISIFTFIADAKGKPNIQIENSLQILPDNNDI